MYGDEGWEVKPLTGFRPRAVERKRNEHGIEIYR